jgi:hypothetical protein
LLTVVLLAERIEFELLELRFDLDPSLDFELSEEVEREACAFSFGSVDPGCASSLVVGYADTLDTHD